ncbi:MAG: hypothetical protein ACXWUG_07285, partial [Polyangiales bacterium]
MARGARNRRLAWFLAAMASLAAGCSSSSFDVSGAGGDDASSDATAADTSADDSSGSDDAGSDDAGSDVRDAAVEATPDGCACDSGLVCSEAGLCCKSGLPVTAFEASPTAGNVCNPLAILTTDGKVAGLDDLPPGGAGVIDGQNVTGCVGVDFGEALSLDPVIVRAAPAGNACSVSACSGTECGSGDEFRIFRGTKKGSYTFDCDPHATTMKGSFKV